MRNDDQAYIKLQKHLDNQAVGFPATRSGVELKILKHNFTPPEAELTCCLNYRFEPLEAIFSRAGHLVGTPEGLQKRLDDIKKRGERKMRKKTVLFIVFLAGIFVFSGPVWGWYGGLKIDSIEVDFENERICIKGRKFGKHPWVYVDNMFLKVLSSDRRYIEADLPTLDP